MCNVIIQENRYDSDFVKRYREGFGFRDHLRAMATHLNGRFICGVKAETITRLAREFAVPKPRCRRSSRVVCTPGADAARACYISTHFAGEVDVGNLTERLRCSPRPSSIFDDAGDLPQLPRSTSRWPPLARSAEFAAAGCASMATVSGQGVRAVDEPGDERSDRDRVQQCSAI
jgi:hypothetical protein